MAYPDNVLYLSTVCDNKFHSAVYPIAIPQFFIKLFSDPKDVVADIFMGSGTSIEAAISLNRQFIGFDNDINAYNTCLDRLITYYEKQ
jgi:DNA modification methylase